MYTQLQSLLVKGMNNWMDWMCVEVLTRVTVDSNGEGEERGVSSWTLYLVEERARRRMQLLQLQSECESRRDAESHDQC